MNLNEWRKQREEEKTLPSGLQVRLRKVSLVDLVANGQIPNTLLSSIDDMRKQEGIDLDAMTADDIDIEEFPQYAGLYNAVALSCVIEPEIGQEPSDDVLGVEELPFDDRVFIFKWANGEAEKLESFREEERES
jgi:hypothetical protein